MSMIDMDDVTDETLVAWVMDKAADESEMEPPCAVFFLFGDGSVHGYRCEQSDDPPERIAHRTVAHIQPEGPKFPLFLIALDEAGRIHCEKINIKGFLGVVE